MDEELGIGAIPETDASPASGAEAATDTEAAEGPAPGPVPYDRFQEVVRARQHAEASLAAMQPWQAAVTALSEMGIAPEQALRAALGNQGAGSAPEPDPEAAFQAELQARGIDPFSLDAAQYELYRGQYELRQQYAELQAAAQQQRAQQGEQVRDREFAAAVAAHPGVFGERTPTVNALLQDAWSGLQARGVRVPMVQIAKRIADEVEAIVQARVTDYAAQHGQRRRVPVVAGGSAPAPSKLPDLSKMTRQEEVAYVTRLLESGEV